MLLENVHFWVHYPLKVLNALNSFQLTTCGNTLILTGLVYIRSHKLKEHEEFMKV